MTCFSTQSLGRLFASPAQVRTASAQRSIVTTRSVALQLASAAPWTSPSRPHMPGLAQTPVLISSPPERPPLHLHIFVEGYLQLGSSCTTRVRWLSLSMRCRGTGMSMRCGHAGVVPSPGGASAGSCACACSSLPSPAPARTSAIGVEDAVGHALHTL
jgi:hypothetical protein